ncbi:MAG: thiamine-phosphate kinase [Acidobacteria bacterium]|nr:MAG: thiamine-phosphate kinase [Acidobacteriota bacterium]
MPGEAEFIERIAALLGRSSDDLIVGIGDDAAVIRKSASQWWLLSVDSQIENVHFRREYTPARLLGHKALAVNLSDIAAMGGTPRFALLSLILPRDLPSSFIDDMLQGMMALADAHRVILIGGDVAASGDGLTLTLTIVGECPAGKILRRDGARPGDVIFVTGQLGLAAMGWRLLERGFRYAPHLSPPWRRLILAHLQPVPRLEVGRALAEDQLASAAIDLSDGLSTDLFHICQASGVGAVIDGERLPVARSVPPELEGDELECALHGGEDYELLFTVPKERLTHIESLRARFTALPITLIGEITDQPQRMYVEHRGRLLPLSPRGHDHLRDGKERS